MLLHSFIATSNPATSKNLDVVLRQEHKAGEKAFVDWAGGTMPIYDRTPARYGRQPKHWTIGALPPPHVGFRIRPRRANDPRQRNAEITQSIH